MLEPSLYKRRHTVLDVSCEVRLSSFFHIFGWCSYSHSVIFACHITGCRAVYSRTLILLVLYSLVQWLPAPPVLFCISWTSFRYQIFWFLFNPSIDAATNSSGNSASNQHRRAATNWQWRHGMRILMLQATPCESSCQSEPGWPVPHRPIASKLSSCLIPSTSNHVPMLC